MTRFLAIVALIALLWIALEVGLRKLQRSPTGRQVSAIWRALSAFRSAATAASPTQTETHKSSQLVRCSVCDVHVAKERSYRSAGQEEGLYCSEACAQIAGRGPRA
jgi:hypothetical protein